MAISSIDALLSSISAGKSWDTLVNKITGAAVAVMFALSTVAFLVGGVGVMNVMLASVKERTREIGVKLAVGARRRTILWQFFSESLMIMLLGGIVGFGLSAGVLQATKAFPARGFTDFVGRPILNPLVIVSTILILLVIGVIAGMIPARTAATNAPIEDLRK